MEYFLIVILILITSAISAATVRKPSSPKKRYPPPGTGTPDIRGAYQRAVSSAKNQPPHYPPPPPQPAPDAPPAPVSADAYAPSEGPLEAAAPTMAESYTGLSEEDLVKPMAVESVVPLAGMRPEIYFTDEQKPAAPASASPAPKAARLPLFEDQREIVRAFIYAEILPSRAYPRRFR